MIFACFACFHGEKVIIFVIIISSPSPSSSSSYSSLNLAGSEVSIDRRRCLRSSFTIFGLYNFGSDTLGQNCDSSEIGTVLFVFLFGRGAKRERWGGMVFYQIPLLPDPKTSELNGCFRPFLSMLIRLVKLSSPSCLFPDAAMLVCSIFI